MPIDPRIPLMGQPAPRQSPFEAIGQITQIEAVREQTEARRLAAQEARQKAADAAAIRRVLTETGGDIEKALPRLRTIAPTAALEFETEIAKRQKEAFQALTNQTELRKKRLDLGLQAIEGADDTNYPVVHQWVGTLSPELAELLGPTYDPTRIARVRQMGLSAKDRADKESEGLKLLTEGNAQAGLGRVLSLAQNAQEWEGLLASAHQLGVPKSVTAVFGSYSPENVQRAETLASKAGTTGVSYQDTPMLLDGKPARVGYNPKTNTFHYQGQDVTARVRPMPPTVDPTLAALRQVQLQQAQQGRSPQELTLFNQIAGQYERSPLVRAADRTGVLQDAVQAIRRNPKDPAAQLQLAYAYIQALDTYQSAVREGELQNLGVLGTKWQQLLTEANRYATTGAFMPPEVAKQIADNAEQVARTIAAGATRKRQEFASRAKASGVGDLWEQFESGMPQAPGTPQDTSTPGGPSFGGSYQDYLRRQQQGKK